MGKGKSVDMLCSNLPQFALLEYSMDTLRQDIGMLVSAPSMEIIPLILPPFALPECSMVTLRKDVDMPVSASSLEIVLKKVKTLVQKMITSFEHNNPKVVSRKGGMRLSTKRE